MANYEATKYNFDGSDLTGIEGTATGTIVPWSAASLPTGFLECNGATVSRSTYSALFAIVGTTYGAGNGSTTFGLPDLQNNVPIGKSNNKALASTGGADTVAVASSGNISTSTNTNTSTTTNINVTGNVAGSTANATLSTAQLASHTHTPTAQSHGFQLGQQGTSYGRLNPNAVNNPASLPLNNAGSGQGHSHNMSANFSGSGNASSSSSSSSSSTSSFSGGTANPSVLQPYLTIIYIIKT